MMVELLEFKKKNRNWIYFIAASCSWDQVCGCLRHSWHSRMGGKWNSQDGIPAERGSEGTKCTFA